MRYAPAPVRIQRLGRKQYVVYRRDTSASSVINSDLVRVLVCCSGLRSISQHYSSILTKPNLKPTSIFRSLLELIQLGLLVPEEALFTEVKILQTTTGDRSHHWTLNLITSDRPDLLRRLVESLIAMPKDRLQRFKVQILDDSVVTSNRHADIATVRFFSEASGLEVEYIDRSARADMAHKCKKMGVDPGVIEAVLGQGADPSRSEGANRNVALLRSMRSGLLTFDDDVVLDTVSSTRYARRLCFSGGRRPVWVQVLRSREEGALSMARDSTAGLIDTHMRNLGRRLSTRDLANANVLDVVCTSRMWQSMFGGRGSIRLTQTGVIGDSGRSRQNWILDADLTCSDRETSKDVYEIARSTRWVQEIVHDHVVTDSPFCMTYALGIDNTVLMPPFLPLRRDTDGVFGFLVKCMYPGDYTMLLPFAVKHLPGTPRVLAEGAVWRDTCVITEADIIRELFSRFAVALDENSPDQVLVHLGRSLQAHSSVSATHFQELIIKVIQTLLARRYSYYESLLDGSILSDARIEDLDKATRALSSACVQSSFEISSGKHRCALDASGVADLQKLCRLCGDILESWPTIVSLF